MEKELFFSGYCRTVDASRMVEVVVDDGKWLFLEWDKSSEVIDGDDITFIGSWEFVENVPEEPIPPITGDSTNVNMWYVISLISMLVLVYMSLMKKNVFNR